MEQTDDLQKLQAFALRLSEGNVKGETFINQTNYNPEEMILSDEDTAGRQVLQLLRIIVKTEDESIYFEYIFNEPTELEEVNLQLEEVYAKFPKKVISVEMMNEMVDE